MYEGFKDRAQAVYRLLKSPETAFVVIASPEVPPLREARYFLRRLSEEEMPLAGVVVNRVTPTADEALAVLPLERLPDVVTDLQSGGPEERAAGALLQLALDRTEAAERERRTLAETLEGVDPVGLVEVPLLTSDVHDLQDLRWLGDQLVTTPAAST